MHLERTALHDSCLVAVDTPVAIASPLHRLQRVLVLLAYHVQVLQLTRQYGTKRKNNRPHSQTKGAIFNHDREQSAPARPDTCTYNYEHEIFPVSKIEQNSRRNRRTSTNASQTYLIWDTPVGTDHPARLASGVEEEADAVRGVAHVERLAVGGVVHPSPPLDRLVSRGVDQHHTQVREEKKPYPYVVVCLWDEQVGVRKTNQLQHIPGSQS